MRDDLHRTQLALIWARDQGYGDSVSAISEYCAATRRVYMNSYAYGSWFIKENDIEEHFPNNFTGEVITGYGLMYWENGVQKDPTISAR